MERAGLLFSRRQAIGGLGGLGLCVATAQHAAARSAFAWPGGAKAAVSLTYDDGLDSQLTNAAPALDAAGFKATFFLTEENMQARVDDWVKVAQAGHEIGDHTVTHPCALSGFTAAGFEAQELTPMEQFLDAHFGPAGPRPYAYPCGFDQLGRGTRHERRARYLGVLRKRFLAARTVAGPPNDPTEVKAERLELRAFEPTYDADDARRAFAYVDAAIASGGWAILVFHEILPARAGEGDTSIATHKRILDGLRAAPVWCAPMGRVFNQVAART